MNLSFTHCQLLVRACLTAALSGLLLGAQAQPTVTSTSPARNATAAPRPSNVALTYSQPINPATAATVRVFSQQAGGRKAFTSASASGNVLTLDPAQDFKPGETVFVTAPATVLSGGGTAAIPYVYQFTTRAGVGPGTFSGGSAPAVGNRPSDVAVADVDGDGDLDLLAANYNTTPGPSPGTVSVRFNDGTGTFLGGPEISVGSNPNNVVAADVDGDGDIDLLTTSTYDRSVSVRLNNGAGVFAAPATGAEVLVASVGESVQLVAAFDIDGDGDLDLLASHYDGISNRVSVRLNTGNGSFVAPATGADVNVGSGPAGFINPTGADVDGDGDIDLLASNGTANTVNVRLNNGAGLFTAPAIGAEVSVGSAPFGLAMADIDGDGDLDLLTGNVGTSTVSVRLNNGAGVFAPPLTGAEISVGGSSSNGAYDVTVGDVDGDGDLDLLTANLFYNTVSVRLNNGTGTFGGGQEVGTGVNTASVTVGDVDGDGDLDLLTANLNSNTVSVRLNQLVATTSTITSFTPTTGPVGTQVTITGTNLSGATAVRFNGTAASSFVVNSATSITAVVAAGTTTGPVSVTTPGGTATSATSFVVRVPPITVPDTYTTPQGVLLTGNVLSNDIGTNPIAILIIRPTHGTLLLNPDGTFSYQPAAGYVGPDSFIYYACDSGLPLLCGNPVTVSITVVRVAPTTVPDAYTTPQNVTLTGNVLANDLGTNPRAILIIRPTHGTLLLNPDGTFTYQPATGYVGADSFLYYACDPGLPLLCGNPATVSLTVGPATSARPATAAKPGTSAPTGALTELALAGSPNPFAEQLRLRFALSATQDYTLAVYDAQGRLVQQLASGEAPAGQVQQVEVPTQSYATGLYLVRLTTATGSQLLKLVKQ